MATVKLTMDKRRAHNDGRYPIVIRLTFNSQSTLINTNVKLYEREWDALKNKVTKVHPDCIALNIHFKNRLLTLEKKLLELSSQTPELNVSELKKALLNNNKRKVIRFLDFADKEIQLLKDQERYGNAQCY